MFNVLFIFFAMAINVALVVHDKINLQNSTDLAVYYAAEKQAEIMNAIAQQNYAIRQSWKLLAWRYRVLGTMGITGGTYGAHPVWTNDLSESPYPPAEQPTLCLNYKPTWLETPVNQNLCNHVGLRIPALPKVKVIAGFLGYNIGISLLAEQLRQQFTSQCNIFGATNWWFAMSILHAFRVDQRNRKEVIYGLAKGLASGKNGDFVDLDGQSVFQGAQATFEKNLTYSNKERGAQLELYNSLEGVDPKTWLVPIKILPTLVYVDVEQGDACNASPQTVNNLPVRPDAKAILLRPYPNGYDAANLEQWADSSNAILKDSDYQFTLGVEKNPWIMAYVGAKATASSREIFFPVSGAVNMVARSFAKPFGGRIGPWYGNSWGRGAQNSSGTPIDRLIPPRVTPDNSLDDPNDMRRLPNYSRFPGDTLGLMSRLAQNSLANLKTLGISFNYYKNIAAEIAPSSLNDVLAWDGQTNQSPDVRNDELAVVAPDLFDITYYSIEPDFSKNYFEKIQANKTRLGIPSDVVVRPDLGSNGVAVQEFSVQDQMAAAQAKSLQRPEAFYFVRSKANLLTDWLPGEGSYNYDVAQSMQHFGTCAVPDDPFKHKNPGSCVAGGGRTGYSVRLISRDMLMSNSFKIGGPGGGSGAIMNPPGSDW